MSAGVSKTIVAICLQKDQKLKYETSGIFNEGDCFD